MKYWSILLLTVIISACNGDATEDLESTNGIIDTTKSGIIEYELNADRLSAVDYNDKLSLIQTHVFDQINTLFKSDTASGQANYDNTLFEVSLNLNDLKSVQSPEGGEAFKNALTDLLTYYKKELDSGFVRVLPILDKTIEERTAAEQKQLDEYDVSFAKKEQVYFTKVLETQEAFAIANNFNIQ